MNCLTLDKALTGRSYKVVDLEEGKDCTGECKPCLRIRLLEFGLYGGEEVEVIKRGDPMIIRINRTWDMALRQDEAIRVNVV